MKPRVVLGMLALIWVLIAGVPAPTQAAPTALPAGFTKQTIGAGLNKPTAMVFENNGRIFVTEKGGAVRVIHSNGNLRARPLLTLSVDSSLERGLLGIALDPDHDTNGFIYVYYSTGPNAKRYSGIVENRVSRLKKRKNNNKYKEKIILDHIPTQTGIHNGGDIHFGADKKLYISVGENGCCEKDARRLDNVRGKILRINSNGTIPKDNPFYNTPGARKEIYAYGFRNPWRITPRDLNQTFIVSDVGKHTWEEINALQAGANYGWPDFEGPCPKKVLGCEPENVDYKGTIPPVHSYNHHTGTEKGTVIAGGVFAENSNYPSPYADAYFYGDTGAGWVHVITMDANNQKTGSYNFDDAAGMPVAFGHGPDGNVYVVDYSGAVHRYVYTP